MFGKVGFLTLALQLYLSFLTGSSDSNGILKAKPFTYDPYHTKTVTARWQIEPENDINHQIIYLSKKSQSETSALAGVLIEGVRGLPAEKLTELGFDFRSDSHCTQGSPKFSLRIAGENYAIGCSATSTSNNIKITAANWNRLTFKKEDLSNLGIPTQGTIGWVAILFNEGTDLGPGYAYLDNIDVNGYFIEKPGWSNYPSPTVTPTVTDTPTPTPTETPTPTPTFTPTPTPTPTTTPVIQELLSYWKMDEGSGNIINNNVNNTLNLELVANPALPLWTTILPPSTLPNSYSLYFDGDNFARLVNTLDDTALNFTYGYTIEAWIKADLSGTQDTDRGVVSKWLDNKGWAMLIPNLKAVNVLNSTQLSSATVIMDGTWHHVAITWNSISATQYIFVDGKQEGFVQPYPKIQPLSTDRVFYLATYSPPDHNFKGYMDEVRIYNYALTQSQIMQDAGISP